MLPQFRDRGSDASTFPERSTCAADECVMQTGAVVLSLRVRAAVLCLGCLLAGLAALPLLVLWLVAAGLSLIGVGVPSLVALTRQFTGWERRRLGQMIGRILPQRYRQATGVRVLRDSASLRDLAWLPIAATVGLLMGAIAAYLIVGAVNAITIPLWWWLLPPENLAVPLPGVEVTSWGRALLVPLIGVAYLALLALVGPVVADRYARLGARVLTPSQDLAERVDYLSRTRAEVLEAHGTELRRIERDLHDSVQAKLVNISVYLGLLDDALAEDHPGRVFAEPARAQAQSALTELRAVVRSIYPPILSDRGLVGALELAAGECAVPCELDADPIGELPAAIESAAYFVVTEAIANAVRHARPTAIRVTVQRFPDVLVLQVSDDGIGGLEQAMDGGGTGIAGIRTRLRAFDGTFTVTSPVGGPTDVKMELPCAW